MTETVWTRIDRIAESWDVLRHPFYLRWSEGTLDPGELAYYAGQYGHAVRALAAATANAASQARDDELARHAAEEAAHVALWDAFADEMGSDRGAAANEATRECVDAWAADDGLLPTLARLYAIERAQPAIAAVKREGLVELYGVEEGPATEYFRLHERLDLEHADEVRELIDELCAGGVDDDTIAEAAESALRGNWRLLDGVDEGRPRPAP